MQDGQITGPAGHGQYIWRRIGEAPTLGRIA
jgi:hypothetical protein